MNSIIFTHFEVPDEGAAPLTVALDRLSAWLDVERDTLGRVLAQAGQLQASNALEALDQLHLEPGHGPAEIRELLEHALVLLEVLLGTLRGMSCRQGTISAWGLPGPAAFDMHVRWSGARLEDITITLERALAT
ncbi:hypothetical protein [Roseovarius sp.]|uniref:hypothetical protein n=1 Tax=Roseovarius sp. TaxID=1486281 RepID=UPI002613DF4A|nr:hypothetical protein [Roseovarius sp.]